MHIESNRGRQKETTPNGVVFLFGGPVGSNYKMRMSGGHSLAAGLDGGNTLIFAKGENVTNPIIHRQQ